MADACRALELTHTTKAIAGLEADDCTTVTLVDSIGKKQEYLIISEPGMYMLCFRSKTKKAMEVKRWLASEVIPSIRKTGSYSLPSKPQIIVIPAPPDPLVGRHENLSEIRIPRELTWWAKLSQFRKQNPSLNAYEWAEKIGYKTTDLRALENGTKKMTWGDLLQIAFRLNKDIGDFFSDKDKKKIPVTVRVSSGTNLQIIADGQGLEKQTALSVTGQNLAFRGETSAMLVNQGKDFERAQQKLGYHTSELQLTAQQLSYMIESVKPSLDKLRFQDGDSYNMAICQAIYRIYGYDISSLFSRHPIPDPEYFTLNEIAQMIPMQVGLLRRLMLGSKYFVKQHSGGMSSDMPTPKGEPYCKFDPYYKISVTTIRPLLWKIDIIRQLGYEPQNEAKVFWQRQYKGRLFEAQKRGFYY